MKLPVFKAFGATYSFVFGNLITCIQIVWLPLAILYGAIYWFALKIFPILPELFHQIAVASDTTGTTSPEQLPMAMLLLFAPLMQYYSLGLLLTVLVFAIMAAGLLRFVIRGERPKLPFYIGFGGDEVRIIITWILFGLLYLVIEIVGAIAVGLLVVGGTMISKPLGAIAAALGCLVLVAVVIWFLLRMSLSGAAAVAVRGIGIGPGWKAAKGNSLNLLVFWVLIALPMIAAGIVVGMVLSGVLLPDLIGLAGTLPHAKDVSPDEATEMMTKFLAVIQGKLPILFAISFVVRLVIYPILFSAGGVAYRFLTEDEVEEEDAHAH